MTDRSSSSSHTPPLAGDPPTDPPSTWRADSPLADRFARVREDQRHRWLRGERVFVEIYLDEDPELRADTEGLLDLIYNEVVVREEMGEKPTEDEYIARFPVIAEAVRRQFAVHLAIGSSTPLPTLIRNKGRPTQDNIPAPTIEMATELVLPLPKPGAERVRIIAGYEVIDEIGRGGMGVVYKARQLRLNRLTALKMILSGEHASAEQRVRFLIEAETIARLQHPNIVQVYEFGTHEGHPYFALEYVDGPTLAAKLKGTPLSPREGARVMAVLARAMHAAHLKGVIHRDLKPANILLASGGDEAPLTSSGSRPALAGLIPKIVDFGLARCETSDMTPDGTVLGTPSYMAPEQAGGNARETGPASDVYSLGAILYELLTGRPPFKAPTLAATLQQVVNEEPVAPRHLQSQTPRDLETICLKCLQKTPARRYSSAAELADDLERFLDGQPIKARPVGHLERLHKWARRKPGLAAALAALAVVTLAGVGGIVYQWREAAAARDAELNRAEKEAEARRRAERELYFNRILLAERELEAGKPAWAKEQLAQCPEESRRWEWYHLQLRCRGAGVDVWADHTRGISCVAISPDGSRVASAAGDGTVRIWSAEGKVLKILKGHVGSVNWVTFGPHGRLASGGEDGQIVLWDAASGDKVRVYSGHEGPISCIAFHPGGGLVASATFDSKAGEVHLWDPADRRPARVIRAHDFSVTGLAFSPDGTTLATAGHDQKVKLWDTETGDAKLVFAEHRTAVGALAWSPDGKWLATGDGPPSDVIRPEQCEVLVWETKTGEIVSRLRGHPGRVTAVAFDPSGERLASGGHDKEVKLWDVQARREVLALRGHTHWVMAVVFSPSGDRLISGSRDKTLRVWLSTPTP